MKHAARVSAVLALCFVFLGVSAQAAFAHAVLVRSFPTDGSRISESPVQVKLYFSEGVRLSYSTFQVADLDGDLYRADVKADPSDPSQVVLDVPQLDQGVYIVSWHILSSSDSHLTDGRILFGVNQDVPVAAGGGGAPADRVSSVEVGLRWLDILFAALVIGGLAVAAFALRVRGESESSSRVIRRRVLTTVAGACVASLAIGVALFVWEVTKIRGSMPPGTSWVSVGQPFLTQGRWAKLWWTRQAALLGLLWVAMALRRREAVNTDAGRDESRGSGAIWVAGAVLLVLLATTRALGSHAASAEYATWAVIVDTIHVLAADIWIGGLLALSIGTWPALSRRLDENPRGALAAWRRFGLLAVISFGVLLTTGLFEAARQVASIDGLFYTAYGKALMVKTGLALVLAGLGAGNAMLLHPGIRARLERRLGISGRFTRAARLPSFVVMEGVVGAVAFLMVGIMTSASPPRGPAFLPGTGPAIPTAGQQAGDLFVSISVTPDLPGTNLITAKMASTLRPAPPEVATATLTLRPPAGQAGEPIPMKRIEPGQFQAGGDQLDVAGAWQIKLTAVRAGMPDAVTSFDLVVGTGSSRTPIVSLAPIGRALTFGGIAAFFALLLGLLFLWRGAGRSSPGPIPPAGSSGDDGDPSPRDEGDQRVLAVASSEGEPR